MMNKPKRILYFILASCFLGGIGWLALPVLSHRGQMEANLYGWKVEAITSPVGQSCSTKPPDWGACSGDAPSGCTVFTVSKGDRVFFGGNDDYINPDSYYWVDPGDEGNYGAIWIGEWDNVQQGVNEMGLAYDANGLPRVDTNPHWERKPVSGGYTSYPIHILRECATVEEVIGWVKQHQWHSYMHDQMQFADASGDAVIISAGADGELVFTRKPPGDGYLVSTNFNIANPTNGYGYPCQRYETATKQLSELVSREGDLAAQDATAVLDAVHVDGGTSWTIESLVADLPNGVVYLYSYHQFDQPVVLKVAEEIANPPKAGSMSKLFPEEVQRESARRYQQAISNQGRCSLVGKAWTGLVLASLVLLILFSFRNPRGWAFWLPVVIILGPIGILIWLIAERKQNVNSWVAALVEATGDIPPITLAYMMMLVVFILVPQAQSSGPLQILFIFVLPLFLGLLFFQGPLLARATRQGYLRTLGQRLPVVWVAANLGMGGVSPVALRLANWLGSNCSLMEPSIWTIISIWTAVVAGSIAGILLILVYEGWAVRTGFRAWTILVSGNSEMTTPGWRKLWWWILLSFAVLIGGILITL
jgi:hypothetical protein